MTLLALLLRELRVASRHAFTYYLRALGAGVLVLACIFFGLTHGFDSNIGSQLFASLHFTLFCAIWILVPLLTADSISRERREGTLGLLFMTRLKASDIVAAKSLAHSLRAMALLAAVVPVVSIPFLLGGLRRSDVALSLLINFSSICWALAAGLLASAYSKRWTRALLGAEILACASLLAMAATVGWLEMSPSTSVFTQQLTLSRACAAGLSFLGNVDGLWDVAGVQMQAGWTSYSPFVTSPFLPRFGPPALILLALKTALSSLLALVLAVLAAGSKTARIWQEEPPSARQRWIEKTFCTPIIWLDFFRRWMRRKLEVNPIGWLEQRTWSGRVVTWSWFGVITFLLSAAITERNFFSGDDGIEVLLSCLLAGSMAMSSAGSFRRERETGVLELLLVSPISEREIILGRLRGLWGQFLPASGLLLAIWWYFATLLPHGKNVESILFWGVTFVNIPVIGLYFSLGCRNFLSAFLATLTVTLLIPIMLPPLLNFLFLGPFGRTPFSMLRSALFQFVIAFGCWLRLNVRLRNRDFPLERVER